MTTLAPPLQVMPCEATGFMIRPSGFFRHSPALDVPPEADAHSVRVEPAEGARGGGGEQCCTASSPPPAGIVRGGNAVAAAAASAVAPPRASGRGSLAAKL